MNNREQKTSHWDFQILEAIQESVQEENGFTRDKNIQWIILTWFLFLTNNLILFHTQKLESTYVIYEVSFL